MKISIRVVPILAGTLLALVASCTRSEAEDIGSAEGGDGTAAIADAQLEDGDPEGDDPGDSAEEREAALLDARVEPWRRELLDMAFSGVSGMPTVPHLRNRSRAQGDVVATCLELDLPLGADHYAREIENWRAGLGFAALALYCAERGFEDAASGYLEEAGQVVDSMDTESEDAGDMGWKRDRIRVTMAQAHVMLGNIAAAESLEQGVADSESGKVAIVASERVEADEFDGVLANLDATMAGGGFDQVRHAMQSAAKLFGRFYGDPDKRKRIEQSIKSHWGHVPTSIRVEVLLPMAEDALEADDPSGALALLKDAQVELVRSRLSMDMHLPLAARLAAVRFRAGDEANALAELVQAVEAFDAARKEVVEIYRAETLRPVAEAYSSFGDWEAAAEVYARVVEEGATNPNSRPVSVDLAETCCSMARVGFRPSEELMERMRSIHSGLGNPW